MYIVININIDEIKYFTDIKSISKHLDVSYQSAYFATKGVIKKLRGFEIFPVNNTDPFIGKYFVE